MEFFSLIIIILVTFFPILLWGYIFSYLDNSSLNAHRFVLGILAGALSVIPVLFMGEIFTSFFIGSWNIFPLLTLGDNTLELIFSSILTILGIAIVIIIFSFVFFFENTSKAIGIVMKNVGIIIIFVILFSLFHTLVFPVDIFNATVKSGGITIGGTIFGTLKLVLFYYLVIGIIEESSKHFSVLTSSLPSIDSVKKGVLFSVFIALGFGFIENILYLKSISLRTGGIWNSDIFTTLIFRSIFSLLVHIICSIVVGIYFSRAFLLLQTLPRFFPYMKTFLSGFFLAIIIHAVYDISLTIGFTGIIFIYFFFGYLGITRVFYQE